MLPANAGLCKTCSEAGKQSGESCVIDVNRNEIYRYLGYRGITPTPEVEEKVEKCVRKLQEAVSPRSFYRFFPLETEAKSEVLRFAGITVESEGLARNLRGCSEICMMAATIGPGVDLLIRRAEVVNMADAVIYQAAGAAMAESFVDAVNESIRGQALERGLFCRPRFSPGYGDFSLEHQRDFSRILEMPKTVGITLADSLLMSPSKSVTAVIGLYEPDEAEREAHPEGGCIKDGCEVCAHPCSYRRCVKS